MKELKCPWCQKVVPPAEAKAKSTRNQGGTVVERKCPHCNKTLAAYLAEDGDFLSRLRTF
ncbi:MAG: hypothetical protein HY671_08545 [Chloroflexi bacterium]|nr:hypothetical protein [Chloroflexota bacterium]